MGSVIIYIEFPTWYWHFDPQLNATVLTVRTTMMVYIFHDHQFRSSIMSPFFYPHNLFYDITLAMVHPPFHPLMYPLDAKKDSNTYLMLTCTIESHPTEPSYPSMTWLTLESSSFAVSRVSSLRCGCGFIHTRAVPSGRGRTQGGGRGDAAGRSRSGFIPYQLLVGRVYSGMCGALDSLCSFLFVILFQAALVYHVCYFMDHGGQIVVSAFLLAWYSYFLTMVTCIVGYGLSVLLLLLLLYIFIFIFIYHNGNIYV